jgi:arsenical pump membrane protein
MKPSVNTSKAANGVKIPKLSPEGIRSAWGIAISGFVLITASALGLDLGIPTFAAAIATVLIATRASRSGIAEVVRDVTWSVLPLVAGLFVQVEALNRFGALQDLAMLARTCSRLPPAIASLTASFGVAGLANTTNNLPSGLLAGSALQLGPVPNYIRHAVLIGTDLGPNLSVTGSLATVLWQIALRREGERITGWTFLKVGVLIMPPALLLASLALLISSTWERSRGDHTAIEIYPALTRDDL